MSTTSPEQSSVQSGGSNSNSRDALASLRINRSSGETTRRVRRRWPWAVLLLLLSGGGGGFYYWKKNPDEVARLFSNNLATSKWVPEIIQNRPEVRLVAVNIQSGRSGDAVVVATGYLESRQQAKIGSRAAGRVQEIKFEEGVEVKANDLLAVLEHADMDAAVASAEASVARAKAALDEQEIKIRESQLTANRAESLWEQRSNSEAERDQAVFAYESAIAIKESLSADYKLAVARRRESEQARENMFIRAPFSGTVISKDAELGESILPGGMGEASGRGSVATIADLSRLEVECDVKEDFITRVIEGQPAEIAVDAVPDRKYHGVVRKIIPMGDRARATIKVKVEVTDADRFLFPEMSSTVYFLPPENSEPIDSEKKRIFCPTQAIARDKAGECYVWVVDKEDRAQKLVVTVGQENDGKTEIETGLSGGERVVAKPGDWPVGQPLNVVQ
jgi:RND family efflux transporter MFP subunit